MHFISNRLSRAEQARVEATTNDAKPRRTSSWSQDVTDSSKMAGDRVAGSMSPRVSPKRYGLGLLMKAAVIVFALDQISKELVIRWLPHRSFWPAEEVLPGGLLRFYHAHNTGVAFGMFQGRNGLFLLLALSIVAGLLFYERSLPADDRWTRIALGMQVGGALGNALDRVRLGHVTDFIDAYWGSHHWPTFNIADSAIVIGVGILMWRLWEMEKERMVLEAEQKVIAAEAANSVASDPSLSGLSDAQEQA